MDSYMFETVIIRQSPIFFDVIICWKKIDEVDYMLWKENNDIVAPTNGVRVETLGM